MKVVALKRIQRRNEKNQRVAIPVNGVFEIEAESAEYNELRKKGAIRNAKASDIEIAKENPKYRITSRMKRTRTIKELRALKAAQEFAAENPDLADKDFDPNEENGGGNNEGENGGEAPDQDPPKKEVKITEPKPGKGKGNKSNLV